MAFEPFATVDDVEAVWGSLDAEDKQRVAAWLVVASTNLRIKGKERGVDIDQYIAGNELLRAAAKNAVVASIRRVLLNPKGLRQRADNAAAGPMSMGASETVDSSISSSRFYFDDDDLLWLPKKKARRFRSFRVRAGLLP